MANLKKSAKLVLFFLGLVFLIYLCFLWWQTSSFFSQQKGNQKPPLYSKEDLQVPIINEVFKKCLENTEWTQDLDRVQPRNKEEFCLCFASTWVSLSKDLSVIDQLESRSRQDLIFNSGQSCRRHFKETGIW